MKPLSKLIMVCLFAGLAFPSAAQNYPSKPVRMVSADAPGSNADTIARLVGRAFGEVVGQPLVVENRPGAGGMIGSEAVVRAAPDGYTILGVTAYSIVVNPFLHEKMPYNPDTDLAPIALLGTVPFVVFVRADGPRTFGELIERIKANPGKYNGGVTSPGSLLHLTLESVKRAAGLDLVTVTYKGSVAAATALMQGEIELQVDTFTPLMPFVKSGKVRALAVSTRERVAIAPDVPTLHELGVTGFDAIGWAGVFAPSQTPKEVRAILEAAFAKAVQDPQVRERMLALTWEPSGAGAEQLAERIRRDRERWGPVVRALGLKVQ